MAQALRGAAFLAAGFFAGAAFFAGVAFFAGADLPAEADLAGADLDGAALDGADLAGPERPVVFFVAAFFAAFFAAEASRSMVFMVVLRFRDWLAPAVSCLAGVARTSGIGGLAAPRRMRIGLSPQISSRW